MTRPSHKVTKWSYVCVALCAFFYCYQYLLRISPNLMQSQIMHAFDLDLALFTTFGTFYFYAYNSMQILVGFLLDRLNFRITMSLALFLCILGTLLITITDQYETAAIGRFIQGFGSAFAFVGVLKIVALRLPKKHFAFFTGLAICFAFLAAALGQMALIEWSNDLVWRLSFLVLTLIGCGIFILFIFVPHLKIPAYKKLMPNAYFFQCLKITKHPEFWLASFISALTFIPSIALASLWGTPYLEEFHHYTETQTTTASSMIFLGWAFGAPLQGWLSDKFEKPFVFISIGAIISSALIFTLLRDASLSYFWVCFLFVLFGAFSASQILTFAIARNLSTDQTAGIAIGCVNSFSMMGGACFEYFISMLLDAKWQGHYNPVTYEKIYLLKNYQQTLIAIPIILFFAGLLPIIFFIFKTSKNFFKS